MAAQLKKIEQHPLAEELLGNKIGFGLTGYHKITVAKKGIRIVWRGRTDRAVVLVVGIGKRDKSERCLRGARRLMEGEKSQGMAQKCASRYR